MENVLVNFEDTGNSFLIVSNFEVLGRSPGSPSVHGARSCTHSFLSAFLSRKHTGNHLQQVSPFKLVGVHLLLKSCLVCISRLGIQIVESFSVRMATQGDICHGWLVVRLLVYGWSFRTFVWLLAQLICRLVAPASSLL